MSAVELASYLVKVYAPTLRFTMAEQGDEWQEAVTQVVYSAVTRAHGFWSAEETRTFIRTLLEGID